MAIKAHAQLKPDMADGPIGCRIHELSVQNERKTVRPYKKLSATARTFLENATPAFVDDISQCVVSDTSYISNLESLAVPSPFVANVRGVVTSCELSTSTDDVPMKNFELVDAGRNSVNVTAFGRHGDNSLIQNGNDIVIFIATCLPDSKGSEGRLWVYDRAHIWLVRKDLTIPQNRKHIALQ